jgi:hypothetical protein
MEKNKELTGKNVKGIRSTHLLPTFLPGLPPKWISVTPTKKAGQGIDNLVDWIE